jgi:hypothetical protein
MFEKPVKYQRLDLKDHRQFLKTIFNESTTVLVSTIEKYNTFIDMVLDYDGIIAGGFAERICQAVMSYKIETYQREQLAAYLQGLLGDIDVWFETPEKAAIFEDALLQTGLFIEHIPAYKMKTKAKTTFASWAKTYVHMSLSSDAAKNAKQIQKLGWIAEYGDSWLKYQVINRVYGTPEQILNDFDFYNAMCYITKDGVFHAEHFQHLVEAGEIHAFKNDFKTISRIAKWRNKHANYKALTKESVDMITAGIEQQIDDVLNKRLKYFHKLVSPLTFASTLIDQIFKLNPKYLVLLAQMQNNNYGYDVIQNIQSVLHRHDNS